MHSEFSPDSRTSLAELQEQAQMLGLRHIALTDHNTAEGALQLAVEAPEMTIVGEEVRSTEGEIIGLFITSTIESGGTPEEILDEIHAQGGLTYLPHPLDLKRWHFSAQRLRELAGKVDIIESYNQWAAPGFNAAAKAMARELGKPTACGCDAHVAPGLGHCWLEMDEFGSAQQFLQNLPAARQVINPAVSVR